MPSVIRLTFLSSNVWYFDVTCLLSHWEVFHQSKLLKSLLFWPAFLAIFKSDLKKYLSKTVTKIDLMYFSCRICVGVSVIVTICQCRDFLTWCFHILIIRLWFISHISYWRRLFLAYYNLQYPYVRRQGEKEINNLHTKPKDTVYRQLMLFTDIGKQEHFT